MPTGRIVAHLGCAIYYTFSKDPYKYVPKYGGYSTTEFPIIKHKDDYLWEFTIYMINGKPYRRQAYTSAGGTHCLWELRP